MMERMLVKNVSRGSSLHHLSPWLHKNDHASMNGTTGTGCCAQANEAIACPRRLRTVGHSAMLYADLAHDQGVDDIRKVVDRLLCHTRLVQCRRLGWVDAAPVARWQ